MILYECFLAVDNAAIASIQALLTAFINVCAGNRAQPQWALNVPVYKPVTHLDETHIQSIVFCKKLKNVCEPLQDEGVSAFGFPIDGNAQWNAFSIRVAHGIEVFHGDDDDNTNTDDEDDDYDIIIIILIIVSTG